MLISDRIQAAFQSLVQDEEPLKTSPRNLNILISPSHRSAMAAEHLTGKVK
jgi:hypothetical protein